MAESCPHHLCLHSTAIVKNYTVPQPNKEPDDYIVKLVELVVEENIDWVIPTCEEIFYVARGLEIIASKCRVFVDSFAKLKRLHSKWDFMAAVQQAGLVNRPTTYLLQTKEDVEKRLSAPGKWVFKRVYSRFSSHVFIVNNVAKTIYPKGMTKDTIRSQIAKDLALNVDHALWIAQQFIAGDSYCSYSAVVNGQVSAHAVYPVEFTAGPGACINFESVEHLAIEKWVQQFVAFENFTGQIAFDFIVTDEGLVYPIECNPRSTSGIHLFSPTDRLDQAFFGGNPGQVVKPNRKNKAMIAPAMLSYGLFQVRTWTLLKKWVQLFAQSREVIFDRKDPRPFVQQFSLLWWNIKISKKQKISIMEATTIDIEWNGEEV